MNLRRLILPALVLLAAMMMTVIRQVTTDPGSNPTG